jgi:hypothetical protein
MIIASGYFSFSDRIGLPFLSFVPGSSGLFLDSIIIMGFFSESATKLPLFSE